MRSRKPWSFVVGVGIGVVLLAMRISPESALVAQAFYFLFTALVIIPVHELGHAVAGELVGFRTVSITLGTGPTVAAARLRGVHVRINLVPIAGGRTAGLPKHAYRSLRWRQWIFTAGGPAANVLIYFALRRMFGPATHDFKHHPFVWAAVWSNWSLLVMNLFPFRMKDGQASDGHGLFTIPFWSAQRIAEEHARSAAARAAHAIVHGDLVAGERLAEEARVRYPESPSTWLMLGSLEHAHGRHETARAFFRQGLAKMTEPRAMAIAKNNIAFMSVMLGREDDLAEAERLSAEVMEILPDVPATGGTRGAVLLRLGRVSEAWPLLLASEAGAETNRNKAYAKAFVACALARRGQRDEALRKLAEARQADPTCDLLPRAEADIAAAATAPPAPSLASPSTDVPDRAAALRSWKGHARLLAFAALIVTSNRFGSMLPAWAAVLVALSLAPELSGVLALATCAAWTAALFGFGFIHSDLTDPTPPGAAFAALGIAVAAWWLVARHRRIGPPPPSRVPTALGWVLAGFGILFALPTLMGLPFHRSSFALAGAARGYVVPSLLFVALVPIVATRRARALKMFAVPLAALAILTLVGASDWYLNRVALADTHAAGASIAWGQPTPARVLRSRTIAIDGRDATLSPNGTAFFVEYGGWFGVGGGLALADFENRLVNVAGTTGAFLDEDRVLVFRDGDAKTYPSLAEVRLSAGTKPIWTKAFPSRDVDASGIEIDRDTGRVYVLNDDPGDGAASVFRTTSDAGTPIEPIEGPSAGRARLLGHTFDATGWDGIFVVERGRKSAYAWWRGRTSDRLLGAGVPDLDCPRRPLGDRVLWCLTRDVSILFKIDAEKDTVERVPGELPYAWSRATLAPSRLAILGRNEIGIVDLDARRGARLTLPEADDLVPSTLARGGGLATVADRRGKGATVVVYADPGSIL